jgi:hypothetical protein
MATSSSVFNPATSSRRYWLKTLLHCQIYIIMVSKNGHNVMLHAMIDRKLLTSSKANPNCLVCPRFSVATKIQASRACAIATKIGKMRPELCKAWINLCLELSYTGGFFGRPRLILSLSSVGGGGCLIWVRSIASRCIRGPPARHATWALVRSCATSMPDILLISCFRVIKSARLCLFNWLPICCTKGSSGIAVYRLAKRPMKEDTAAGRPA